MSFSDIDDIPDGISVRFSDIDDIPDGISVRFSDTDDIPDSISVRFSDIDVRCNDAEGISMASSDVDNPDDTLHSIAILVQHVECHAHAFCCTWSIMSSRWHLNLSGDSV